MAEENLRLEIKRIREAYAALEAQYNVMQTETANLMSSNTSLEKNIKESEKEKIACQKENKVLLASKQKLCEDIQRMTQSTVANEDKLKALQKKVNQLNLELGDIKVKNEQYRQENAILDECLINASNQVEGKLKHVDTLQHQVAEKTEEINKLNTTLEQNFETIKQLDAQVQDKTRNIKQLKDDLHKNVQNRDKLVGVLQNNRVLTADKNKMNKDLINILQENEKLQSKASDSVNELRELQINVDIATNTIAELEEQKNENLGKHFTLTETLTNTEASLKDTSQDRDVLNEAKYALERKLAELRSNYEHLEQSFKSATEQLLKTLDKKAQLDNDQHTIHTAVTGDTMTDFKLSLLSSIYTTRSILDRLDNFPDQFVWTESDAV